MPALEYLWICISHIFSDTRSQSCYSHLSATHVTILLGKQSVLSNQNSSNVQMMIITPFHTRTKPALLGLVSHVLSCTYMGSHTRIRYRPRFFDQVGYQTTYASMGNKHFFTKYYLISNLPNSWTELTKIGHNFRKQSTEKKVFKKFHL